MTEPFDFVETRGGLDWLTWHPHWRPLLAEFGGAELPEIGRSEPSPGGPLEWGLPAMWVIDLNHLPVHVRDGLCDLAAALWDWSMPESGIALLRDMVDELRGATVTFLSALREALVAVAGDETVAMHMPMGALTGTEDGTFPLHADLFQTGLLFNLFEDVRGPHGATLLLTRDDYEDLLRARVPAETCDLLLSWIRREEFDPSTFDNWCALMYDDPQYGEGLCDELAHAATVIHFARGEGYVVDDSAWLHGREFLPREAATYQRLLRLSFDTRESRSARPPLRAASGTPS